MNLALGLIETKGLIGAIEAADAMAKAANIKITDMEKSTAALVTIKIVGEVAAVKAAVDAGSVAAQRVGQLVSAHVIPRPHDDIESLFISEREQVIPQDSKNKFEPAKKIEKVLPHESKKEEQKISAPPDVPQAEKIKEKPIVKTTTEPAVEPDKKEEIKKEIPAAEKKEIKKEIPSVEKEEIKKEIPAAEKGDSDELKRSDHLKELREEAQKEMNFSEKSKQEPLSDGAGEDIALTENEKLIAPDIKKSSKPAKKKDDVIPDENKKEEEKVSPLPAVPKVKNTGKKLVVKDSTEPVGEQYKNEEIPGVEEMEKMNVHQLRKLARSIPTFPLKGREVSKANRGALLDYLKKF